MSDFDELGGRLRSVAEQLGDLSARLRYATDAAQGRDFRAADPGGLAAVTVDGRPRVIELNLHPDALRTEPDELDRLLTGLLNDALGQAREATRQAMVEALPAGVRTEVEQAAERPQPMSGRSR
ncbi:hypothetical protein Ade02nite_54390 [Paractinoplanes deccanensis]|uniref:YbaB/EbfC DNA-binding family protein n=1 Tax=Paractinoplanes deccanensis TaxID=113561 RepID=A0ABQ3Y9W3_9ACTN|nr:YbaB/EbfC family nucleoid-associated protein [Actinoplanes deccanensis]GID76798.1 hypothetical protein Ade02nite_54390 [Actinoplanes deccanensis]